MEHQPGSNAENDASKPDDQASGDRAPAFELVPPAPLPPRPEVPMTTITGETLELAPQASASKKKPRAEKQARETSAGGAAAATGTMASLPGSGRGVFQPLQGRPRIVLWLLLVICLGLASALCFPNLSHPGVTQPDEAVALAAFSETYSRHEGLGPARGLSMLEGLVPYLHGQPLDQPPALTWLQMTLAQLYPHAIDTPDDFIHIGRVLSGLMLLLTVTCVYWAGHCIGGYRTALFAGLLAAVNPLLIYHGRLATPTIAVIATMMLAIAAALWAIRPLRAAPSVTRQGLGWGICGLAMGIATFIAGLGTVPVVTCTILLILLLCPSRVSHLMGLIAAMLISALMIVSWIAVSQVLAIGVPWWWSTSALTSYWVGMGWSDVMNIAWQAPLWVMAAVLPWSVWLIGAVIQPFSSSSSGTRMRMFLSWAWFMLVLALMLTLPMTVRHASLLMVTLAACVFVGQLFNQYMDLARTGRYARFWRWLRWPHLLLVTAASIALPLWFYFHGQMLERFHIEQALFDTPPRWVSILLGLMLLALTGLSWRWALANHPGRSLIAWAAWTFSIALTLMLLWTAGPRLEPPMARQGHSLARTVRTDPLYWIRPHPPQADLTFYAQVFPAPIDFDQLQSLKAEQPRFFLLADSDLPIFNSPQMRMLGTVPGSLGLWRVEKSGVDATITPQAASQPSH